MAGVYDGGRERRGAGVQLCQLYRTSAGFHAVHELEWTIQNGLKDGNKCVVPIQGSSVLLYTLVSYSCTSHL